MFKKLTLALIATTASVCAAECLQFNHSENGSFTGVLLDGQNYLGETPLTIVSDEYAQSSNSAVTREISFKETVTSYKLSVDITGWSLIKENVLTSKIEDGWTIGTRANLYKTTESKIIPVIIAMDSIRKIETEVRDGGIVSYQFKTGAKKLTKAKLKEEIKFAEAMSWKTFQREASKNPDTGEISYGEWIAAGAFGLKDERITATFYTPEPNRAWKDTLQGHLPALTLS